MEKKLEQLIKKNEDRFDQWLGILNEHNYCRISERVDSEKYLDSLLKTANMLGEVTELLFKYGSFKDEFDNSKFYQHLYGPHLIIVSKKCGFNIDLGIDIDGIYLETHLKYAKHLRHMDDKFWSTIVKLSEQNGFDFEEQEHYGKDIRDQYGELFMNKKSTVFRILRNYMVGVVEKDPYPPMGTLKVLWNESKGFDDIIGALCVVFKDFYKLNYDLWKIEDLTLKSRQRSSN